MFLIFIFWLPWLFLLFCSFRKSYRVCKNFLISTQNINESACIPQPFWLENSKVAKWTNHISVTSPCQYQRLRNAAGFINVLAETMTCLFWAMPRIISFGLKKTKVCKRPLTPTHNVLIVSERFDWTMQLCIHTMHSDGRIIIVITTSDKLKNSYIFQEYTVPGILPS